MEHQGLNSYFVIFIVSGSIFSPKGHQTTTRRRRVLRTTVKSLNVAADCEIRINSNVGTGGKPSTWFPPGDS